MGFVETVSAKRPNHLEYVLSNLFIDTIFHRTINEVLSRFLKNFRFLLPHGFSHIICFSHAKTADNLSDFHNLFLIDNNTVGLS